MQAIDAERGSIVSSAEKTGQNLFGAPILCIMQYHAVSCRVIKSCSIMQCGSDKIMAASCRVSDGEPFENQGSDFEAQQ
jgi:hypothetical protein